MDPSRPEGAAGAALLAVVLATAFGSMAVYSLLGRKRDADAIGKGAQLLLDSGDFFLHWFLWAIAPAVWLSLRLRLTPDFYNLAGLLMGILSGVCIAKGYLALGGWAIALGGVCDILDGRIARLTA